MSELVSAAMIAEIKQFIVENLEYESDTQESGEYFSEIFSFGVTPTFAIPQFSLSDVIAKKERSFSDELNELVTKSGRSNAEIYTAAQMDRRLFSKICNKPDYRPTKLTALALAIALELTLDQTKEFISRAGYALTHSSVTDLVVEFFISKGIYNVQAINEALYELDQPLLGNALA